MDKGGSKTVQAARPGAGQHAGQAGLQLSIDRTRDTVRSEENRRPGLAPALGRPEMLPGREGNRGRRPHPGLGPVSRSEWARAVPERAGLRPASVSAWLAALHIFFSFSNDFSVK